jgi:hypothetical protein
MKRVLVALAPRLWRVELLLLSQHGTGRAAWVFNRRGATEPPRPGPRSRQSTVATSAMRAYAQGELLGSRKWRPNRGSSETRLTGLRGGDYPRRFPRWIRFLSSLPCQCRRVERSLDLSKGPPGEESVLRRVAALVQQENARATSQGRHDTRVRAPPGEPLVTGAVSSLAAGPVAARLKRRRRGMRGPMAGRIAASQVKFDVRRTWGGRNVAEAGLA